MPADAPLSHGQLFSWREIERYPDDWMQDANLPIVCDLRGLPMARVENALRVLMDRHEPLRTTYHVVDGQPVQRVHESAELPIERVDRVVRDWEDPEDTKDELCAVPFAMEGGLLWRGRMITTNGSAVFLALSFSHLIMDVWSINHLTDQFSALIGDPGAVAELGPTPSELAREQRTERWRDRHEASERYWRRTLGDVLADPLPTLPAKVKRDRIEATLHSHRLGGLASLAARRLGVTAPALVMALVTAGLARHTGVDTVTMSLMASNRFSPEHHHVIGTMNQLIPVVATVDPGAPLGEHVKRLHWAGAKAYRYSSYDVDRIAALAAEVAAQRGDDLAHDCWVNQLFRCWFNYVQLDRRPSDATAETPAELSWTPLAQQYGQPFRVRVTVANGRTSVFMLADPTIIPAEGMAGMLRTIALGVQVAATAPETSLKDLWDADHATLAPSLFPATVPLPE
uniref:condensation domain-containing protein n=1 Tax=Herbidospora sakaeratensis TaxID=564415 RepID=UPI000786118C|nr:condensation domain-containing protein [Herbidospora sakaeratensis]